MKKLSKAALIVAALSVVSFCSACQYFEKYPQDNMVEEAVEDVIENMVEDKFYLPEGTLEGQIDLSPMSPEKK